MTEPVYVDSFEKFVAAFGLVTAREDPDDDTPLWQRLPGFRKFDWQDAANVGLYPLWSRCNGERFGPPYDELSVTFEPLSWKIGFEYFTDPAYGQRDERNRSISVQFGPFHLSLGRTW